MIKKFQIKELHFFYLCILLNIIPVFQYSYFVTLDGVAHLHNSNIINNLIFDNSDLLSSIYSFNEIIVPNWMGHFFNSLFNLFLPANIAEKMVFSIYLIFMPLSFRLLVKLFSNNQNILYSYFIFPFTYSILFHYGFMNFSIGFVFLFFSIYFFLKKYGEHNKIRYFLVISILILATYLSHLFVFILLLITLFIVITVKEIYEKSNGALFLRRYLMKLLQLGLLSITPLILFTIYFLNREGEREYTYLGSDELLSWIINVRPIIHFHENELTKIIFWVLIACTILFAVLLFIKRKVLKQSNKIYLISTFILLLLFLLLFFKMPDSDGFAGFFSIRFCLILFIIWILFLSTIKVNKYILTLFVLLILFVHVKVLIKFDTFNADYNKKISKIVESSKKIKENSVVFPVDFTGDWIQQHFSNYLGIDKSLIILENYELSNQYFPLKWNYKKMPKFLLDNKSNDNFECLYWVDGDTNESLNIDYVFIYGNNKNVNTKCYDYFYEILNSSFIQIYNTEYIQIYEFKG